MGDNKWYGWKPDLPDFRDMTYKMPYLGPLTLPAIVDLRPGMPKVIYDQGALGSCTACAIGAAVQYSQMRQKPQWDFTPSRLFIYYNERAMEGTISADSGAMIRDGIKSVNSQGVCREDMCPYDISKFRNKPSMKAYKNALLHKALSYQRMGHHLNSLKSVLADGTPFVFGFTVYNCFESDEVGKTGVLQMPAPTDKVLGGHAVLACGYDDTNRTFLVRNSWGDDWGQGGYFTIPYDYLLNPNLADDFWAITAVST